MTEKPKPSFAPAYVALYPLLAEVARTRGYALCIHGSISRDFDLVAVPWIDNADTAEELIAALTAATGAAATPLWLTGEGKPARRSHGRLGWSLYLGTAYLDVSVMPLVPRPETAADA